MPKLSIKEQRFIEAKAQGLSNTKAALHAVPGLKPKSAGNTGMRMSKKVEVSNALDKALKKHDITMDKLIKPIGDALTANKLELMDGIYHDSGIPDHTTRLKASSMGIKLLQDEAPQDIKKPTNILSITSDMSDQELAQALFKNKDDV